MSKKLLEEQAVRKFMKIAGLQPLTNTFLRENDGKNKVEESKEELDEAEELDEGGGQMPFDAQDRRADDRAPMEESKGPAKMKGAPASMKMKPAATSTKNTALKEEEEMPAGMDDVEVSPDDMDDAAEAPAAGGLDVEALVKDLIGVITARIPGASDVVSVESEGDETEIEMGGDEEAPGHEAGEGEEEMEGGDEDALDEVALTNIVAETVKRVKARLKEGKVQPKAALDKQALAKKVAAKVVQSLKKS